MNICETKRQFYELKYQVDLIESMAKALSRFVTQDPSDPLSYVSTSTVLARLGMLEKKIALAKEVTTEAQGELLTAPKENQ